MDDGVLRTKKGRVRVSFRKPENQVQFTLKRRFSWVRSASMIDVYREVLLEVANWMRRCSYMQGLYRLTTQQAEEFLGEKAVHVDREKLELYRDTLRRLPNVDFRTAFAVAGPLWIRSGYSGLSSSEVGYRWGSSLADTLTGLGKYLVGHFEAFFGGPRRVVAVMSPYFGLGGAG